MNEYATKVEKIEKNEIDYYRIQIATYNIAYTFLNFSQEDLELY